jgi:hypothetical protein
MGALTVDCGQDLLDESLTALVLPDFPGFAEPFFARKNFPEAIEAAPRRGGRGGWL